MSELEHELRQDLTALEDRFANDNQFSHDLYRALANITWHKQGAGGHVSLSWGKAEELVNELRARVAQDPLELAQTGGEGDVAETVRRDLEALGWSVRPLNTSRHDPQHVAREEGEPRAEGGNEALERAHAEADRDHAPPATVQGTGGGGAGGSAGGGSQS